MRLELSRFKFRFCKIPCIHPPNLLILTAICTLLISYSLGTQSFGFRQTPQYLGHDHSLHLRPDEYETIQIHFRTRLRSPSDLLGRDFHILSLHLPHSSPVEIHLHRNKNLVHPSVLKEGFSNHAIFRGNFYPGGSVALTATRHDHGFSGHIIQGRSHFYLEPTMYHNHTHTALFPFRRRRSSDNTNSSSTVSLPHKLYKMDRLLKHDNGTHADVVHVPRDELEKAIEEMDKEMTNNSTEYSPTYSNSTENPTPETNDPIPDSVVGIEDDAATTPTLGNTFASNQNQNRNNNKNRNKNNGRKPGNKFPVNKQKFRGGGGPRKKNRPGTKTLSPTKSGSEGSKIVEIAVFADPKLTKVWESKYPKDGKTKMRTFILNLINNMDLLYQQPSLGIPLSIRLVHLEMLSGSPSGLDPSGGEATKYLKSFCKYAGNKNEKGAQWDHALLLTGHNLKDGGDSMVAGMAWFSTMCLKYWSCSVSEGTSFSTSFILTHELGHSLGMEHDGSGVSKGCASNKFIMSPTTGSGKTSWSSCSSANLKDFIAKGSPEVGKKDLAAVPTCLTRSSPLKQQQIRFSTSGGAGGGNKLPGEIYSLQIQCELDCGTKCRHHKVKNEEGVCAMLFCEEDISGGTHLEVSSAHPALEGSFCGSGKYCRYGKCVKIPAGAG